MVWEAEAVQEAHEASPRPLFHLLFVVQHQAGAVAQILLAVLGAQEAWAEVVAWQLLVHLLLNYLAQMRA